MNVLSWLQKRMAAEQLRALVEGAPFMVHTASWRASAAPVASVRLPKPFCSAQARPQPALQHNIPP